jgi:hypothetical protein
MHKSVKLLFTALAASLLLGSVVSNASAGNLSVSNSNLRATFASLEFNGEGLAIIRCPVTLEGSFHSRTIPKVERLLIGAVTSAVVKQASCTNGVGSAFNGTERYNGITPANTLPWHVTYESFSGTLPTPSAVNILFSRFRFGLRDNAGFCTGQYGSATDNITAAGNLGAGGAITSLIPIDGRNTASLIRRDAGIACPNGRMRGTGSVMLLGSTTLISVTLI